MSPRHHPSAEILATYVAGAHEPGFGLVVGAHVETCAECRSRVAAFEATSGAALNELPHIDLGVEALARTMARLDAPAPKAAPVDDAPVAGAAAAEGEALGRAGRLGRGRGYPSCAAESCLRAFGRQRHGCGAPRAFGHGILRRA